MIPGEEFARKFVSEKSNKARQPKAYELVEQLLQEIDALRSRLRSQDLKDEPEPSNPEPSWSHS